MKRAARREAGFSSAISAVSLAIGNKSGLERRARFLRPAALVYYTHVRPTFTPLTDDDDDDDEDMVKLDSGIPAEIRGVRSDRSIGGPGGTRIDKNLAEADLYTHERLYSGHIGLGERGRFHEG